MNDGITIRMEDDKRRRVLEGATGVFLSYGYNRTTMDDIARAAEMSRPALYLLFRNKAEIFRALGDGLLEQSLAGASAALSGPGSFRERVEAMSEAGVICHVETVMASPHGAELLGAKDSLAVDLAQHWREQMAVILARAISAEAAAMGIDLAARGLSARAIADHFFDAVEGMKNRIPEASAMRAGVKSLVALIERALAP